MPNMDRLRRDASHNRLTEYSRCAIYDFSGNCARNLLTSDRTECNVQMVRVPRSYGRFPELLAETVQAGGLPLRGRQRGSSQTEGCFGRRKSRTRRQAARESAKREPQPRPVGALAFLLTATEPGSKPPRRQERQEDTRGILFFFFSPLGVLGGLIIGSH
jgi:hypothetical protein